MIEINKRKIGKEYPPYIIAEMSANHNGSLDRAMKIISMAKHNGADAIKFQHRHLNEVYGSTSSANDVGVEYTQQLLSEVNL